MLNPIILSYQNVTKVTRISKGLIFRRNVTKRTGLKNWGPFFFNGTTGTNVTKGDPMLNLTCPKLSKCNQSNRDF